MSITGIIFVTTFTGIIESAVVKLKFFNGIIEELFQFIIETIYYFLKPIINNGFLKLAFDGTHFTAYFLVVKFLIDRHLFYFLIVKFLVDRH